MKRKTTFFLLALLLSFSAFSQWQNQTLNHASGNRQYRIYIPTNYNAANPASLVLTLHGLGDNMTNFSGIGFAQLAETNNIIVVCPQALSDPLAGTAWNSGAGPSYYIPNANVDDVGFISSLIDVVSAQYAINPNKVFSCGFSMGGFMTEKLALRLNNKIKAFASVAGTFGNGIMPVAAGTPGRPVSIAHFHGTSDGTIAYTGNTYGNDVSALINYWVTNNQSNPVPVQTALPNTANDGYTIDHYKYTSPNNNSVIELFKVNGADHVWLTAANDISYTTEIWNFFNRYIVTTLSSADFGVSKDGLAVYPNPVVNEINFNLSGSVQDEVFTLAVFDISGRNIVSKQVQFSNGSYRLSVDNLNLNSGTYFAKLTGKNNEFCQKIIIQ
ncbi:T9SS type A sorting domain-containing protein [Flavobacterium pedocola]